MKKSLLLSRTVFFKIINSKKNFKERHEGGTLSGCVVFINIMGGGPHKTTPCHS